MRLIIGKPAQIRLDERWEPFDRLGEPAHDGARIIAGKRCVPRPTVLRDDSEIIAKCGRLVDWPNSKTTLSNGASGVKRHSRRVNRESSTR